MTFDLRHIWATMSLANKAITAFIALMAVLSIAVTIERVLALSKSAKTSRRFAQEVKPALAQWDTGLLVELAEAHKSSTLARLFAALGTKYAAEMDRDEGRSGMMERVRNESTRQLEALGADMRRGLSILATIGSITPFVGLLGTVIGIIGAFQAIGAAGAGGIGTVSVGISEALIETAFGLAVAIPAVIAFNYLTARIAAVEAALGRSAGQLLDEMEVKSESTEERISDVTLTQRAA